MKLIVGLGNPGKGYALTRHNMGFMVLEELAAKNGIRFKTSHRFKALIAAAKIGEEKSCLAMPKEYMNLSGNSVSKLTDWLKIDLNEILLVVDDVALPLGTIRIRAKGSEGGHKGLRSVIDCVGTNKFARMRIGIMGREDVKDLPRYVLSRFTKKEQKFLPDILERASQACECWVKEGVEAAMNRFNAPSLE